MQRRIGINRYLVRVALLKKRAFDQSAAIMQCLHSDQKVSSIAKVKKNELVPAVYRLKARMVNVRPKDPSKMIKVYCDIHKREYVPLVVLR
jgi:hypothetical protein